MDFARPRRLEEGVTTRSNIRYIPFSSDDGDTSKSDSEPCTGESLDKLLVEAANTAAIDLFLGPMKKPLSDEHKKLVDSKLYKEHVLPISSIIEPNALVVIFESFDNLNFVYATPGEIFSNRNGHFPHNDFIGKPFGCKIRSRNNRGLGFVYLLRPTAELWARSLKHRTQIVHELDASMVVFYLHLRPNMTVVESGTGSGAMSHAILRSIAPKGQLHTFEFNKTRAETAREEFAKNKVHHVTVHHKDVCGKTKDTPGGFGLGAQAAHAIFLDLPEPWLAIPHAAHTIMPNGRIASYSPCVEQTQRATAALASAGFHSIKTIEVRLQEHYVDDVELELPPKSKLPREVLSTGITHNNDTREASMVDNSDTGAEADTELTEGETEATDAVISAGHSNETTVVTNSSITTNSRAQGQPDGSTLAGGAVSGKRKRTMICARPFGTMRGHTAFLTFATAGNKLHPDPNSTGT